MVPVQKHWFLQQAGVQGARHFTTRCWCSSSCTTPWGLFLCSKKSHPVPRVRTLPCAYQLSALASAYVPLFQEAKAILPSTGPEISLAANVSWTKPLLVPSGALWNQDSDSWNMLVLFHRCQELSLFSLSCSRDSHYQWWWRDCTAEGVYEQRHLLQRPALCEGFLVRGSVAQLLLKAVGNFT